MIKQIKSIHTEKNRIANTIAHTYCFCCILVIIPQIHPNGAKIAKIIDANSVVPPKYPSCVLKVFIFIYILI